MKVAQFIHGLLPRALAAAVISMFLWQSPALEAAVITDFHVYAARNVQVGVGSVIGQFGGYSLVGAGTMTGGVGDANVAGTSGIYGDLRAGDDVSLGNSSFVTGTITNPGDFIVGSGVTYGAHLIAIPDLPSLPAPAVFSHGVTNQSVGNGATMNLAPGSYQDITLGAAATLNLSAGDYFLRSVSAANGLTINVNLNGGDINIYLTDDFSIGGLMAMNFPTGGDWTNVYAEAHHVGLNAFRIGGGNGTNWSGNVYTPFGDIHVGSGSSQGTIYGHLWAGRDVDIEHGLDVLIPAPSPLLLAAVALGLRRRRTGS